MKKKVHNHDDRNSIIVSLEINFNSLTHSRAGMVKELFMYGLQVMEVQQITVMLMAMSIVFTL